MIRKLVSIQRVISVSPIVNADAIDMARVLGWRVVIKKAEFAVGDLVVYAEVDSVFPDKPEFDFLRDRNFRIRTARFRGQISQGICFPLSILPAGNYEEGQDVTDILGVTKYESIISPDMAGVIRGDLPVFLKKSEEFRIQIMQSELENELDNEFVATEKLDGLSEAIYKYNDAFGVCSKHVELFDTEGSLYWKMVKQYDLETKLRKLNRNISLQGELIGWGIRANKYKLAEGKHDFYLFKVFDIDNHCYLNFDEMLSIAKELGLKTVPVVSDSLYVTNDIEELVAYSGGKSVLNPKIHREGVVISRKQVDKNGVTFSFKVINPVFLLKYQDD